MNAAPNFSDLLNNNADEIERPKPLPAGSYLCTVKGLPEHGKSAKKQTPFVNFTLAVQQALDDVDADDLGAMGGTENKTIKATYYLTENSLWRLKEFLEHCGIDLSGKTLAAAIDETVNCSVVAQLKHEASEDRTAVFAKLANTAAA